MIIIRKRVAGLTETGLARFLARACTAAKLQGKVNVLVTSSPELRSLNRRFRGNDEPTDVLSFPPMWRNDFAGDIAISADIAVQNAQSLGHPAVQEIKILMVHGVLHLAGYDHDRDNGEMARKEEKLRRTLGLPGSLITRSGAGISKEAPRRPSASSTAARRNTR